MPFEAERDALLADRSQLIDLFDERAPEASNPLTKRGRAEQKKLKELRASTSWKLTKPVRSLGGRAGEAALRQVEIAAFSLRSPN